MRLLNLVTTFATIACLSLTGCDTTTSNGITTRTLSKLAQAGEGYVFFSLTFAGEPQLNDDTKVIPNFDGYVFKIRRKDNPFELYEIGVRANVSSGYYRDFNVSRGMGFVFAEPLPAGEYEIFSYDLTLYKWSKSTSFSPVEQASFPFTVTEGSYTYLGRIECHHIYDSLEAGLIDSLRPSGVTFAWSDHQSVDVSHAYMKFPHLISLDLIAQPLGPSLSDFNGPTRKSEY